VSIKSPHEMADDIAKRAKMRRLSLNLSQRTLSERSGVSYGTLKKFERSGQISLESLLKLALTLDAFDDFEKILVETPAEKLSSLDELLKNDTRQRGRT
jgi:transcriptional regulator with XRE-family HTH domain